MDVDLTYRPFQADDFEALHGIMSHWSVVRQLGRWPWPPEPGFTKGRCRPYDGDGFVWAVCLDGRLIGSMAVTNGELGYVFAPEVHGKGIATRVSEDAIINAFATSDRSFLNASVWEDNVASAKILRKNGFTHWQTHYTRSPARLPTLVHQYRLSRTTWDRLRTTAQ